MSMNTRTLNLTDDHRRLQLQHRNNEAFLMPQAGANAYTIPNGFRAVTHEQGVEAALRWVTGETDDRPDE